MCESKTNHEVPDKYGLSSPWVYDMDLEELACALVWPGLVLDALPFGWQGTRRTLQTNLVFTIMEGTMLLLLNRRSHRKSIQIIFRSAGQTQAIGQSAVPT